MPGDEIPWGGIEDFSLFGRKKRIFGCETVDFATALSIYAKQSYLEAAIPRWEAMRVSILESGKAQAWDAIFDRARGYAENAFNQSVAAQELERRLDVGKIVFLADLPCIGAAMERLVHDDWQGLFYNRALDIYNAGYWVCGYRNGEFIACGEAR